MRLSGVQGMCLSGVRALGLLSVMMTVVSSETLYVRSGGNITGCMKCYQTKDILNLYRDCGGREDGLLSFRCYKNYNESYNPRILLDTSSLCWTLLDAVENDSCVYKLRYHNQSIPEITTDVRVVDPVLIFNITSIGGWLGEETAVRVQFSGEESAMTWEVDGEPLPERYRLIDDNRTLIIPGVQRDDAERSVWVRITNPVSEETWNCQLQLRDLAILSNITCNSSRLGEDMAVNVLLSVEDKAVTWEVDREPPDGYQLMEGNRTLIIPGVQRNDTKRKSWVGITILISEETWKFWRKNGENNSNQAIVVAVFFVGFLVGFLFCALVMVIIYMICRKCSRNLIPETATRNGVVYRFVPPQDGPVTAVAANDEPVAGPVPAAAQGDGPVPAAAQGDGPVPAAAQGDGPVPAAAQGDGPVPAAALRMDPMPPLPNMEILRNTQLCMRQTNL